MVSKGTKRRKSKTETPAYSLEEINKLIKEAKVDFWPNARRLAQRDFGWSPSEIIKAIKTLQLKDFYKREQCDRFPLVTLDVYKPARKFEGKFIYIHLYVDDEANRLIINSCKER